MARNMFGADPLHKPTPIYSYAKENTSEILYIYKKKLSIQENAVDNVWKWRYWYRKWFVACSVRHLN